VDDLTQLALAAQQGDDRALAALIRATQGDVWRVCAHVAGAQAADDLAQETFLRAWRSLPRYEARASVRTWLLVIARRTAIDGLRAAGRRPAEPSVDVPTPDHAGLVTTEHVFAGLDPERREALFLTQLLGLSYAEAAAVCGVPVGTIRSRVFRGREDMVAALRAPPDEAGDVGGRS
jgi:RNA polymerase sigma-70 factor (ECF subfamily)